jgi:O-antigen ligase
MTYMGSYVFFNKKVTMKQRFQLIMVVVLGLSGFLLVADDTFWERMSSISEESGSESGGGGRKLFWSIAWNEVVRDYPMGVGGWGFAYLSPHYVPQEFMPQNANMRAVHSLYFQCLVERGYWGAPIWFGLILSNFLFMRKIKKHLVKVKNLSRYFQALAIESGFIAFLIAAVFLNRLNSEILYWQPMFIACFGNIYLIKDYGAKELEENMLKKKKKK